MIIIENNYKTFYRFYYYWNILMALFDTKKLGLENNSTSRMQKIYLNIYSFCLSKKNVNKNYIFIHLVS